MRRFVFVLAALLSAVTLAQAQAPGSGVLAGTVRTSEGTPVPSLVLIVRGPDSVRTVVTGPEGRYRAQGRRRRPHPDLALSAAPVREHVVVAATRDEAALSTVGVSATVLDSERIAEREAPSVLTLLEEVP